MSKKKTVPVSSRDVYACNECGHLVARVNRKGTGKFDFVDAMLYKGSALAKLGKRHPCWAAKCLLNSSRSKRLSGQSDSPRA